MEKKSQDQQTQKTEMDEVRELIFATTNTESFFVKISDNLQKYDEEYKKNFILMALAAGMAMRDTSQNKDWKRIQKYATKQLSSNVPILRRENFCNNFIEQLPDICENKEKAIQHINKVLEEN